MKTTLFVIAVLFSFTACQKELSYDMPPVDNKPDSTNVPSEETGDIKGTWRFVHYDIDYNNTQNLSTMGIKTNIVTKYKTRSYDNQGTINFDGSKVEVINLAYAIKTEAEMTTSSGGISLGTEKINIDVKVPEYSTETTYTLKANNGIHFDGGFVMDIPNTGNFGSQPAYDAVYYFESGKLVIKIQTKEETEISQNEVTGTATQEVTVTSYYQRQ